MNQTICYRIQRKPDPRAFVVAIPFQILPLPYCPSLPIQHRNFEICSTPGSSIFQSESNKNFGLKKLSVTVLESRDFLFYRFFFLFVMTSYGPQKSPTSFCCAKNTTLQVTIKQVLSNLVLKVQTLFRCPSFTRFSIL